MTVYIVQKLHWEYQDFFYVLSDDEPLKAFESRDDAEAYRNSLERAMITSPRFSAVSYLFKGEDEGEQLYLGPDGRTDWPDYFEVVQVEVEG